MPTFKLDGQDIAYQPGDTIIRAAWKAGVEIPHYCWHPGLSIAANCRMCLVELKSARPMALPVLKWDNEKNEYVEATKNKLQPACQIEITEGLEVESKSQAVKEAQAGVQEFLLLNHPVDCPICDQAGECKLQDYWDSHQKTLKRKETEPVHKPKAVRFGPTIVYDAERCIMCTRCIRFCDEVVGDHVLDMRERGNRNEITVSPGRELDHAYSLMTEHVCPVGALTSKDFRFKARVWFLKTVPGVCTGCATGCNTWIDFDPRNGQVHRLRPRDNAAVNKFWMCDDGMMTYKSFHDSRVLIGKVDGQNVPATQSESVLAKWVGNHQGAKTAVVLNACNATEDNHVLHQFATKVMGVTQVFLAERAAWKGDAILRSSDHNPNRAGVKAVVGGAPLGNLTQLQEAIRTGAVTAVISLGADWSGDLSSLAQVSHLNLSSNHGSLTQFASVVLPVASVHEMQGAFMNQQGVHQTFMRAALPPQGIKTAWETLVSVAKEMKKPLLASTLTEIRSGLSIHAPTIKHLPVSISAAE